MCRDFSSDRFRVSYGKCWTRSNFVVVVFSLGIHSGGETYSKDQSRIKSTFIIRTETGERFLHFLFLKSHCIDHIKYSYQTVLDCVLADERFDTWSLSTLYWCLCHFTSLLSADRILSERKSGRYPWKWSDCFGLDVALQSDARHRQGERRKTEKRQFYWL